MLIYAHVPPESWEVNLNEHILDINVPESFIKERAATPPGGYKAKAGEITLRLAREMGAMVQGVYFMPLGWSELASPVVTELRKLVK
jgi:hypothetical protein